MRICRTNVSCPPFCAESSWKISSTVFWGILSLDYAYYKFNSDNKRKMEKIKESDFSCLTEKKTARKCMQMHTSVLPMRASTCRDWPLFPFTSFNLIERISNSLKIELKELCYIMEWGLTGKKVGEKSIN